MRKERILLLEDEAVWQAKYRRLLGAEGYDVRCLAAGEEAELAYRTFGPDLVIIDLTLAGRLSGWDVLGRLKAINPHVSAIILTADADEGKLVRGLSQDADDYVLKTASDRHLLARVKRQLRRTPAGNKQIYRYPGLVIDLSLGQAIRDGASQPLEDIQLKLLKCLLQTPGEVVSYAKLRDLVWGTDVAIKLIQNCVHRLRGKLGKDLIQNRTEEGYWIQVPEAAEAATLGGGAALPAD